MGLRSNCGKVVSFNFLLPFVHFLGFREPMRAYVDLLLWILHRIKKVCTSETCFDDIPPERSGATGTILDHYLYMFGGYSEDGNLNTLYRLNLFNLKWHHLKPSGIKPLPCDKTVSWQHNGKFYLFSGYGPAARIWNEEVKFEFIADSHSQWVSLALFSNLKLTLTLILVWFSIISEAGITSWYVTIHLPIRGSGQNVLASRLHLELHVPVPKLEIWCTCLVAETVWLE